MGSLREKDKLLTSIFKLVIPAFEKEDDLVGRVQTVKQDVIKDYENIKKNEVRDLLIEAKKADSKETAEKLHELAEKSEIQIEEIKIELEASEEYLQSIADVIGRR